MKSASVVIVITLAALFAAPLALAQLTGADVTVPATAQSPESADQDRDGLRTSTQHGGLTSFGKEQIVPADAAVTNVVTIAAAARVDGIAEKVVTIFGSTIIGKQGAVVRDAVTIFGNVVVEEGGVINGDAISIFGTVLDPGNGIHGSITRLSSPMLYFLPITLGNTLLILIAIKALGIFGTLLLSYLVVAVMPRPIARAGDQLVRNPLISGLVGIGAAYFAAPFLWVMLAFTCIGLLIIPILSIVGLYLGLVIVYHRTGYLIRSSIHGDSFRPFLDVTIGVLVIHLIMLLITFIPLFNILAWTIKYFLLASAGFGALLMTKLGTREGVVEKTLASSQSR